MGCNLSKDVDKEEFSFFTDDYKVYGCRYKAKIVKKNGVVVKGNISLQVGLIVSYKGNHIFRVAGMWSGW